jgi:6-phosphofructokinase 1
MGVPSIGVPGTIDNDLAYTDYTIGFDTAVNTVLDAINKLRDTSSSHERISIIEVMGRRCGDIALYAGLAGGAEYVIVPEVEFKVEELCKTILEGKQRGKLHYIILLAEGVGNSNEIASAVQEITALETRVTILGHIQRGGSPSGFDRVLASRLGARAVELLAQNSSSRVVGVRGGEVVDFGIDEALEMQDHKDIDHNLLKLAGILAR